MAGVITHLTLQKKKIKKNLKTPKDEEEEEPGLYVCAIYSLVFVISYVDMRRAKPLWWDRQSTTRRGCADRNSPLFPYFSLISNLWRCCYCSDRLAFFISKEFSYSFAPWSLRLMHAARSYFIFFRQSLLPLFSFNLVCCDLFCKQKPAITWGRALFARHKKEFENKKKTKNRRSLVAGRALW